jgi:hypothetical protein
MAEARWDKINPDMFLTKKIMDALSSLIAGEWATKERCFIPHAATWLNGERWEDEPNAVDSDNSGVSGRHGDSGGRPFQTGSPPCGEPISDEERREGLLLLRSLHKALASRMDMRERFTLKGRERQMLKRFEPRKGNP